MKISYSKEEIDFIVEKYKDHQRAEVAKLFKEKFNREIKSQDVANTAYRYATYKKEVKKINEEHVEYLKDIYQKYKLEDCKKMIEEKFGISTTLSSLRSILHKYKIYTERETKFQKGNKLSPEHYAKIQATMFKKGKKPFNAHPIGHEINCKGYIWVKVADDLYETRGDWMKNWKPKSKIIYEQHHGPVPEGHQIIFADGNNRNFDIDNLIAVSKREICYMNKTGLYKIDKRKLNKQTVQIAKLDLKIYDIEKEIKNGKNKKSAKGDTQ